MYISAYIGINALHTGSGIKYTFFLLLKYYFQRNMKFMSNERKKNIKLLL